MRHVNWPSIICIIITGIFLAQPVSAGDDAKSPSVPTVYEVHIPKGLDRFEPSLLKIKAGDTVKWINEDVRAHPLANIPGKGTNDKEIFTSPISPGNSWSHTFNKAGEYPYFCYIHYVMMGAVIVEEEQGQTK